VKTHDPEHVEGFLPLHPEAFRILTVLHGEELHGYAIVKALEQDPGRPGKVMPANLYRRLRTLLAGGLLEETDGPAGEDVDERRRYFAVTSLGRAVARAEARRMEGLLREAREVFGG
jgi:DNA-binding PadR family transcriptional regulator